MTPHISLRNGSLYLAGVADVASRDADVAPATSDSDDIMAPLLPTLV